MKKIGALFVLLGLIWLIKLSYDMYALSNHVLTLQNDLYKSEQKNANLNDRLVAIQRTENKTESKKEVPVPQKRVEDIQRAQPVVLIKSQLELIQFALQQQQYVFALEKLNQIDLALDDYDLAESNRAALHAALSKDKQNLQQFVLSRNTQMSQLEGLLSQIDLALKAQQHNQNIELAAKESAGFWRNWIKIERVDMQAPEIVHRRLILKEAQMRIILAKQELAQGHILDYQNMLSLVVQELSQLPDQQAQKIMKDVQKLKQSKLIQEAKLLSLAIMG